MAGGGNQRRRETLEVQSPKIESVLLQYDRPPSPILRQEILRKRRRTRQRNIIIMESFLRFFSPSASSSSPNNNSNNNKKRKLLTNDEDDDANLTNDSSASAAVAEQQAASSSASITKEDETMMNVTTTTAAPAPAFGRQNYLHFPSPFLRPSYVAQLPHNSNNDGESPLTPPKLDTLPIEVRLKFMEYLSYRDVCVVTTVSKKGFWILMPLIDTIYITQLKELRLVRQRHNNGNSSHQFHNVKKVHISCLVECHPTEGCQKQIINSRVACRIVPFLENFAMLERVWLQGNCSHNNNNEGMQPTLSIYYDPQKTRPTGDEDMRGLIRAFLGSCQIGNLSRNLTQIYGLRCPRIKDSYVDGNYPSDWKSGGCRSCQDLLHALPLDASYTTPSAYNGWHWDKGYCPDYMPCMTELEIAIHQSSRVEEEEEEEESIPITSSATPTERQHQQQPSISPSITTAKQQWWKDWVLNLLECSVVCQCHGPKFVTYHKEILDAIEFILKNRLLSKTAKTTRAARNNHETTRSHQRFFTKTEVFQKIIVGFTFDGDYELPSISDRYIDQDVFMRLVRTGLPLDRHDFCVLTLDEYNAKHTHQHHH